MEVEAAAQQVVQISALHEFRPGSMAATLGWPRSARCSATSVDGWALAMTSCYTPDDDDHGDVRMRLMLALFLTAAFGALDLWVGVPTGLLLGLPPLMSGATATAGALLGAALVTLAGEQVQHWIYSRHWFAKRRQRVERLWNRYGIIGVAFQSPVLAGTLLSTTVALGLGAPARKLLLWMSISLVFWGAVLTGAVVLGFSIFESWEFLRSP